MQTILEPAERAALQQRIEQIDGREMAQWGKMSCNQMVCHLADQIRVALGEVRIKQTDTFLTRTVLKRLVLLGVNPPKGKVPTFPELDFQKHGGTPPVSIAADKKTVIALLDKFCAADAHYPFQAHAAFGALTQAEWGRLILLPLRYHLAQFGR